MADWFEFLGVFFALLFVVRVRSHVVELGDNFKELKKDGRHWFVEFYAPWCGHCQKLEPVWQEVGAELARQTSTIVTAKIDCTKHRQTSDDNRIRGFPTIKFFRGNFSSQYTGSMTSKSLVEYALKASRPILTEFKTVEEFEKRKAKPEVFFLFVKDESEQSEKFEKVVQDIAEQKISQVMFYKINSTLLPKTIKLDGVPNLVVFKDAHQYIFEDKSEPVNKTSLSSWVDGEKFLPFLLITESNINELAETEKMIVFLIFSKHQDRHQINKRLGEVTKKMAYEMYSTYGRHFQFAGLFDTDAIESIIMSNIEVPLILVLNPELRVYYMIPSSELSEDFDQEQLETFLQDILNGKALAHGGKTASQRVYRLWWDVKSSAKQIWKSSPFMACLVFGLPLFVIGFLIVMLCCLEPMSDEHEEDGNINEQQEVNMDEKADIIDVKKPSRLKED